MQLNITFRNLSSSDSLKDYAKDKVERVHKYLDRAGEAHVVLSLERHLHHADITITPAPGNRMRTRWMISACFSGP